MKLSTIAWSTQTHKKKSAIYSAFIGTTSRLRLSRKALKHMESNLFTKTTKKLELVALKEDLMKNVIWTLL